MQVWCDWQVTLCDPHLSALEVRFSRRCAIQIDVYLYLYLVMSFHPPNFGLLKPFHSRASDSMFLFIDFVRVTNCFYDYDYNYELGRGTRQTDGRTDTGPYFIMPLPYRAGHNNILGLGLGLGGRSNPLSRFGLAADPSSYLTVQRL